MIWITEWAKSKLWGQFVTDLRKMEIEWAYVGWVVVDVSVLHLTNGAVCAKSRRKTKTACSGMKISVT